MKKILIFSVLLIAMSLVSFAGVDDRIDLNMTSYRELMFLPGITKELAEEIINYRNKRGGFENREELIPIIGEIIFENIKNDIKVTPVSEILKGKLDGKLTFSAGRSQKYPNETFITTGINFTSGDTFKGYIEHEEFYWSYDLIKKVSDPEISKSFTYNIYKYEKPEEEVEDPFVPKIYKKITVEEQRKKYEDIISQLENKYGTRLSVKDDNKYVTGYYESNPSADDYFKHPDTKKIVSDSKEEKKLYETEETDYTYQNYQKFEDELEEKQEDLKEKEQEDTEKRNIYRKLKYKVDFGYMYLPYVKSNKFGSKGDGISIESYFDSFDLNVFYIETEYNDYGTVHEDPIYGVNLETNLKNGKVGTMFYKLTNKSTDRSFDHFMIYGEKKIDSKTELYVEYGQLFDGVSTFFFKGFTKFRKMNITSQLKINRDNCYDYDALEPYGTYPGYFVVGDAINPLIKIDYYLPKGNKVTWEYEHYQSTRWSSKGLSDSYSTRNALTFKYIASKKLKTEWYFANSYKSNYDADYSKNQVIFEYTMKGSDKISLKLKKESDSEKPDNYVNYTDFRIYKKFSDSLRMSFVTGVEDVPGPAFVRLNEFSVTQKLSPIAELEFTQNREMKKYSNGGSKDTIMSELAYEMKF